MTRRENIQLRTTTALIAISIVLAIVWIFSISIPVAYGAEESDELVPIENLFDEDGNMLPLVIDPPTPVIEEEPVPLAAPEPEFVIPSEKPPLAVFVTWALMNLILTVITAALMVVLLINYSQRVKSEFKENSDNARNHLIIRLGAIAATAIAVILFVVTQDMRLPMFLADNLTLVHFVITAAVAVLAVLGLRKNESKEEIADNA